MDILVDFLVTSIKLDGELFFASESKRVSTLSFVEFTREDAHADQVAPVDPFEGLGDDCLDALEIRSFGCPVSAGATAVLRPCQNNGRLAIVLIFHGCIVEVHHLAGRDVQGLRAYFGVHLVDDPSVGEGASGHDLVVASATAVAVEVLLLDVVGVQEPAGWGILSNGSGGGNVVGGDEVAEVAETVGVSDVIDVGQLGFDVAEERRVLNVGGVVPGVETVLADWQLVPPLGALGYFFIIVLEHFWLDDFFGNGVHLFPGGPDISEIDVLSLVTFAQRSEVEVDVNSACQSVGHHQRRTGEVVALGQLVHSSFEVAVATQHSRHCQVILDNGLVHFRVEVASVADAGHAAEPSLVES